MPVGPVGYAGAGLAGPQRPPGVTVLAVLGIIVGLILLLGGAVTLGGVILRRPPTRYFASPPSSTGPRSTASSASSPARRCSPPASAPSRSSRRRPVDDHGATLLTVLTVGDIVLMVGWILPMIENRPVNYSARGGGAGMDENSMMAVNVFKWALAIGYATAVFIILNGKTAKAAFSTIASPLAPPSPVPGAITPKPSHPATHRRRPTPDHRAAAPALRCDDAFQSPWLYFGRAGLSTLRGGRHGTTILRRPSRGKLLLQPKRRPTVALLLLGIVAAVCLTGRSARAQAGSPPISLHPDNPHYFLFRGRPAVLIGSTEHYGAVLNLDFDTEVPRHAQGGRAEPDPHVQRLLPERRAPSTSAATRSPRRRFTPNLAASSSRSWMSLSDISDRTGPSSARDLLRLYERWLRTGSRRTGQQLAEQGSPLTHT